MRPPVDGSKETTQFSMGDCLPPVPAKVVEKILRGQFIDMAELLRDKMEVERRRSKLESASASASARPARREVPDLLSWVQCFGVFASVIASKYPERTTQLLAYQATIICEARRCGRGGWQGYDNVSPAGRLIPWARLVTVELFSFCSHASSTTEWQGQNMPILLGD